MKLNTVALGGLDYSRCKRAELDSFYVSRAREPVPESVKNKTDLIHLLRRIDRRPWSVTRRTSGTFRFLDLPAEMRNMVYSELLVIGSGCCKTNLLTVSRQMHEEAAAVLYGNNVPQVDVFWNSTTSSGVIDFVYRVFDVTVGGKCLVATLFSGYTFLNADQFYNKAELSKFKRIKVKVYVYDNTATEENMIRQLVCSANHTLYSLFSFLAGSKALKQCDIQFVNLPEKDVSDLASVLREVIWPISLLSKSVTVSLSNEDKPLDIKALRSSQPAISHTSDGLCKLTSTYNLSRSLTNTISRAGPMWENELAKLGELQNSTNVQLNMKAPFGADHHQGLCGHADSNVRELTNMAKEVVEEIEERKARLKRPMPSKKTLKVLDETRAKVESVLEELLLL